jgi:hypothetical protein
MTKPEQEEIMSFEEFLKNRFGKIHSHHTIPEELLPKLLAYIIDMRNSGFILRDISEALNISTLRIRNWLAAYPEFDREFRDAETNITDRMEREAIRRAMDGVMTPVVSNGRVVMDPSDNTKVYRIREFSDDLLKFLLKGRRRDLYGDRVQNDTTHTFSTDGALDELKSLIASANEPTSGTPAE